MHSFAYVGEFLMGVPGIHEATTLLFAIQWPFSHAADCACKLLEAVVYAANKQKILLSTE